MNGKRHLKSWPKEWPDLTITRRKKQRYIRLRVYLDRIALSGPTYCSLKEMKSFVFSQEEHISRSLTRLRKREEKLEEKLKGHENQMLLRGTWKTLQPADHFSSDNSFHRINGDWRFAENENTVFFRTPTDTFPDKKVQLLYYRTLASREIRERFQTVAQTLPFHHNRIFIRSQKTRWGTCSSKGNVSFNWRLIKCPHWIWDYLFVHELCHTVHMNHSAYFWKLVNSHYPQLEEARIWIREHEPLIFAEI